MSRLRQDGPPSFWQRLPSNIWIGYLLWLISLGLFVADFFFGRILVVALVQLTGLGYWQVSFFDRLSVLIFGLIGAAGVIFVEYYYRKGAEKGLLWPRFIKMTAWQVGLILAAMLIASLTGD